MGPSLNPRVVEALISGIGDRELLTREASIQSLGRIGDPKAVQHLVVLLGDRSYAIRLSAIKALEEIGDPRQSLTFSIWQKSTATLSSGVRLYSRQWPESVVIKPVYFL